MWLETVLLCCAGCISIYTEKIHMAVCFFASVFYIILYGRTYTVKELLLGSLFLLVLLGCEVLSEKAEGFLNASAWVLKVAICILVCIVVVKNYVPTEHSNELTREQATAYFIAITSLLLFSVRIRMFISEKMRASEIWIYRMFIPALGFYIVERIFNENINKMEWQFVAGNVLVLFLMTVILYGFIPVKIMSVLFLTICLVFGVGNYYVGRFRGSPIMPNDLYSVNTAFQVAGGYEFDISEPVIASVLCWYAGIAILCCLPGKYTVQKRKAKVIIYSFIVCVCIRSIGSFDAEQVFGWNLDSWDISGTYQEAGSILGFSALLKKMSVDAPENYSVDKVEKIFESNKIPQNAEMIYPTIIAVMDETFSDLRTLGDFSCTDDDYLKHWYAMDDYRYRGKLYVSVYGGQTANSEFEFLTGCSMGNCGTGVVPYQSYNLKNVGNIADILRTYHYKSTAIHPQYKGNWNRMKVYSNMGFQDFLGLDDFENPVYLRGAVSDDSSFEKVIQIYEKNGREEQFIFNVTMQNHGGYHIEDLKGMDTIALKGEKQDFTDVETYLTLIRESDRAIQELLEYFKNVDEPVVICIFGDHLPALNEEWIEHVTGKNAESLSLEELERRYAVPYMIWTNYETGNQQAEMDISANYLGAFLLDQAGIPRTDYTNFLLHMREEIPVFNVFGYQTKDGQWHSFEEETEVSGWVEQYRMLQYYTMFDSGRKMEYYR